MSTFCGQTKEYPNISLDRFDGQNMKNAVFFLSHNHRDHTQGLFTDSFIYKLQSNQQVKLYCSEVTRQLLLVDELLQKYLQKCPALEKSIVALPIEESKIIPVIDPDTGQEAEHLTVTLLPAGHCPGSVMFLIEGDRGNVLYTGDFRLERDDLCKMRLLHSGNGVKTIQSMYVDTTFCVPNALHLPSRQESASHVINIVEEWISQSCQHVVHLHHKADLGYEHLYRDLASHFHMKIHVLPKKFNEYKKIGDMQTFTTSDPTVTQIHACRAKKCKNYTRQRHHLPCDHRVTNGNQLNVRTITVSTMSFVQNDTTETTVRRYGDHYYRVLYSFHSSYAEVRDMILYLKPSRAAPNVIPMNHTQQQIQERLDRFVKLAKEKVEKPKCSQEEHPLGKLNDRKRPIPSLSQYSDDGDLDFGEKIGTPVKKRPRNNNILATEEQMITDETSKSQCQGQVSSEGQGQSRVSSEGRGRVSVEDQEAFPLLFGRGKADEDGDMVISPAESYDPSQSLFSDDGLLPEDQEWLKQSLESVQSREDAGSETEYCSETGTEESGQEGDGDISDEEPKETPSLEVSGNSDVGNIRETDSVELCEQNIDKSVNNKLCKSKGVRTSCSKSSDRKSNSVNDSIICCTGTNPVCVDNTKQSEMVDLAQGDSEIQNIVISEEGSTSKLNGSSSCNNNGVCEKSDACKDCRDSVKSRVSLSGDSEDLDNSIQVVKVVGETSGSSASAIELEQVFYRSSRERHISEVMNDYPKGSKDGDTPEEIQRPSVMRYPTSGFHTCVNRDKRHAVQGYHNLITNIEKILKSPTRSDGDEENQDCVVLDCRGGNRVSESSGGNRVSESSGNRVSESSGGNRVSESSGGNRVSESSGGNVSGEASSTTTKSYTQTQETAESAKNKNAGSEKKCKTADSSPKYAPTPLTTNVSADEMQDSELSEGEDTQDRDDVVSLESVECIDLTNDDAEEETEEDAGIEFHGSSCCTEEWSYSQESELGSAQETEGDAQSEAIDKDKHKRLRKKRPHNDSNSYSSDSDSDVDGYKSENWFMDLRKIKPLRGRNGLGQGACVNDDEVIVLDDSSPLEGCVELAEQEKESKPVEVIVGEGGDSNIEKTNAVIKTKRLLEATEGKHDPVKEIQLKTKDFEEKINNNIQGTTDSAKDKTILKSKNSVEETDDVVKKTKDSVSETPEFGGNSKKIHNSGDKTHNVMEIASELKTKESVDKMENPVKDTDQVMANSNDLEDKTNDTLDKTNGFMTKTNNSVGGIDVSSAENNDLTKTMESSGGKIPTVAETRESLMEQTEAVKESSQLVRDVRDTLGGACVKMEESADLTEAATDCKEEIAHKKTDA